MAAAKKTVKPVAVSSAASAPKTETKKAETPAAVKAEPKKAEPAAAVKTETKKAETPAAAVVKAETKKAEPAKKVAAKKAPAKKAPAKKAEKPAAAKKVAAKKTAIKTEIELQIEDDKKYTQETLLKIAKDVWKYDLGQKASDLASVELYIKPDERLVYYVMNKEFTGSFGI